MVRLCILLLFSVWYFLDILLLILFRLSVICVGELVVYLVGEGGVLLNFNLILIVLLGSVVDLMSVNLVVYMGEDNRVISKF